MGLLDTFAKLNPVTNLVSSLVSSVGNYFSTKDTNKANQAINNNNIAFNREENERTRKFNASEAEKSRDFNAAESQLQFDRSSKFAREMWEAENEYNSPANQVARLIEAGLNPNLFDGANTAGSPIAASSSSASSSPASASALGAPSAIPMQAPTLQNPAFQTAQIDLMRAEANKMRGDTNLANAQANRINELLSEEKRSMFIQNECSRYDLEKLKPAQFEQLQQVVNESKSRETEINQGIENLKKQWLSLDEDVRKKHIENDYLPKVFEEQIKTYQSQQNLANSSAALNDEQIKYVSEQMAKVVIENKSLGLDYNIRDSNLGFEVTTTRNNMDYELQISKFRKEHPYVAFGIDKVSGLFGSLVSTTAKVGAILAK